jgi:DNA-binding MarR family transcriptional regulator
MENQEFSVQPRDGQEQRMLELMERMWAFSADQMPAEDSDLTMSQLRVIDFISKHIGCHLQEVADGLHLTPPTVSVAIKKLEEGGWLERRPDPDDGRAACVFLTKRSETAVRQAVAHQGTLRQLFFNALTEQEQNILLDLLEKGITSVEEHLKK